MFSSYDPFGETTLRLAPARRVTPVMVIDQHARTAAQSGAPEYSAALLNGESPIELPYERRGSAVELSPPDLIPAPLRFPPVAQEVAEVCGFLARAMHQSGQEQLAWTRELAWRVHLALRERETWPLDRSEGAMLQLLQERLDQNWDRMYPDDNPWELLFRRQLARYPGAAHSLARHGGDWILDSHNALVEQIVPLPGSDAELREALSEAWSQQRAGRPHAEVVRPGWRLSLAGPQGPGAGAVPGSQEVDLIDTGTQAWVALQPCDAPASSTSPLLALCLGAWRATRAGEHRSGRDFVQGGRAGLESTGSVVSQVRQSVSIVTSAGGELGQALQRAQAWADSSALELWTPDGWAPLKVWHEPS